MAGRAYVYSKCTSQAYLVGNTCQDVAAYLVGQSHQLIALHHLGLTILFGGGILQIDG
jgi:hypothetical protein